MTAASRPDTGRRRILRSLFALPIFTACGWGDDSALAQSAIPMSPMAATPACPDDDDVTPRQIEGPYFTPNSPLRTSLFEPGMAGTRLTLTGQVLTRGCAPVAGALLDFWQADARGVYDNEGYRFRGHQFADAKGSWRLETVVPGLYPGRTRHIHVRAQARGRSILTTQLYFPGVARNRDDALFDRELLVRDWRRVGERRVARFDFVLEL